MNLVRSCFALLLCSFLAVTANAQSTKDNPPAPQKDEVPASVFNYVEKMPASTVNLNEYLAENIVYPISARKAGIEGRVIVSFIVTETGDIEDVTIAKGIGKECDDEALRVVRDMPKWKPGYQNGKAVKVYFKLPINFALTDN